MGSRASQPLRLGATYREQYIVPETLNNYLIVHCTLTGQLVRLQWSWFLNCVLPRQSISQHVYLCNLG